MELEVQAPKAWPEQQSMPHIATSTGTKHITAYPLDADMSAWKAIDVRGVYLLTNSISRKAYVGSSERVVARLRGHVTALRKGKHVNSKLSNAWTKHGENLWSWAVLEVVEGTDKEGLLSREQHWIDHLDCAKFGYNIAKVAGSPMKGRRHTDASRAKCVTASAKLNRDSPVYRSRLSASSSGPRNAMYGRPVSQSVRDKIAAANTGKRHSEATRTQMSATAKTVQKGERNGFYGRKHTAKTKAMLTGNLAASRAKSIEANQKRKGKTWDELYDAETIMRMREALVASNKRRAHGTRS